VTPTAPSHTSTLFGKENPCLRQLLLGHLLLRAGLLDCHRQVMGHVGNWGHTNTMRTFPTELGRQTRFRATNALGATSSASSIFRKFTPGAACALWLDPPPTVNRPHQPRNGDLASTEGCHGNTTTYTSSLQLLHPHGGPCGAQPPSPRTFYGREQQDKEPNRIIARTDGFCAKHDNDTACTTSSTHTDASLTQQESNLGRPFCQNAANKSRQ
jgi:hypothetical protein